MRKNQIVDYSCASVDFEVILDGGEPITLFGGSSPNNLIIGNFSQGVLGLWQEPDANTVVFTLIVGPESNFTIEGTEWQASLDSFGIIEIKIIEDRWCRL